MAIKIIAVYRAQETAGRNNNSDTHYRLIHPYRLSKT
jgi:hypothetical protein